MKPEPTSRIWFWFALTSVLCLVVLAVSPVKDYFREYRDYQQAYKGQLLAAAGSSKELRQAQAQTVGVRQIWVRQLNNAVDRCTSCHLGVENQALTNARQPYTTHPETPHTPQDFLQFGCVICHRGQGRATALADAHGHAEDWSSPILPLAYVEASCGVCHEGDLVPEASLLSAGRSLMRQAGCAGCHEIKGLNDWRSEAPRLDGLAQKTSSAWLQAWLKAPRKISPRTLMPDYHLGDEEVRDLVAYLKAQRPMVRLEQDAVGSGDMERGEKVFREARCISCHTVDGRGNGSAPELATVGSKVNRPWLLGFLANPHAFQPETKMPRYGFDQQQLLDLTEYMMQELIDPEAPKEDAQDLRPSPKMIAQGEKLFQKYGCGGCHALGERLTVVKIGPSLIGIGDKPADLLDFGQRHDLPRELPAWLAAKVTEPRSFRGELRMPDFGFTPEQINSMVVALLSNPSFEIPPAYRVAAGKNSYSPPGRFGRLVTRYRCLSCHQINEVGDDIAKAPLTLLGSKANQPWIKEYLLLPTTIRPILTERMIPLGMTPEEAGLMADFISNVFVDNAIEEELFPKGIPADSADRGRRLFHERHGCQACHQIGGVGGYYGPPLDGTPRKLKSGWVAWWVQGPQRWRKDVRCPDYGINRTDAVDISAYLLSLPSPSQPVAGGAP